MTKMRTLAPAKINVFLRIVGQRPDGYHLLESLMVPVSLYDEIMVEANHGQPEIVVACDDPTVPGNQTNLAYKAATLLCRVVGVHARILIDIHKHIPAGAGLGGGSSDAAAVLKSLNSLLSLGLTENKLCELGVRLGADVPFFIPCRPAKVKGIGEALTALPLFPLRWFVLVVPPFRVSTPWAYRRFDELPSEKTSSAQEVKLVPGEWSAADVLVNDLERAVLPAYPQIATIKTHLLHCGAEGALMSGSGSAVFGIFQSRPLAEQAAGVLTQHGQTFLVESLTGPPA